MFFSLRKHYRFQWSLATYWFKNLPLNYSLLMSHASMLTTSSDYQIPSDRNHIISSDLLLGIMVMIFVNDICLALQVPCCSINIHHVSCYVYILLFHIAILSADYLPPAWIFKLHASKVYLHRRPVFHTIVCLVSLVEGHDPIRFPLKMNWICSRPEGPRSKNFTNHACTSSICQPMHAYTANIAQLTWRHICSESTIRPYLFFTRHPWNAVWTLPIITDNYIELHITIFSHLSISFCFQVSWYKPLCWGSWPNPRYFVRSPAYHPMAIVVKNHESSSLQVPFQSPRVAEGCTTPWKGHEKTRILDRNSVVSREIWEFWISCTWQLRFMSILWDASRLHLNYTTTCQVSTGTNLGLSMSTSGAATDPTSKTSTVPFRRGTKTEFEWREAYIGIERRLMPAGVSQLLNRCLSHGNLPKIIKDHQSVY